MAYNPSEGRVFYVSPSGNNTNDGRSPARPWQTISKINAFTLIPGDTILFEGGKSFAGTLTLTSADNGAAGNPVTFGSYGVGRALITADAVHGISMTDCKYINITDINIQGLNQTLATIHGVAVVTSAATSDTIRIQNMEVWGFKGWGIYGKSGGTTLGLLNMHIENVVAHDNAYGGIGFLSWRPTTPVINGSNVVIKRCKAYNNSGISSITSNWTGTGIFIEGVDGGLIEHCEAFTNGYNNGCTTCESIGIWTAASKNIIIQHCESYNHYKGTASFVGGGGFDIDGGSQNCIIQHCYSHNNSGAGCMIHEYGSGITHSNNTIRYCISHNDGRSSSYAGIMANSDAASTTGYFIYNNLVIVDSDGIESGTPAAISTVGSAAAANVQVFNNIFIIDGPSVKMAATGTMQGTFSNNIYYAIEGANLNFSTGGTITNPYLRGVPKLPPTVGVYGHGGLQGFLNEYKIQYLISPARNAGGSGTGLTLPTSDFWGLPTPQGTRNIGPHETV